MNVPFEWASLFTAEKFNERPGLNECPTQTRKGALIWKFAMSAEALIQIVCKNDEKRVFFSQIFFVFHNKEIYKTHFVMISKLRRSCFPFLFFSSEWRIFAVLWVFVNAAYLAGTTSPISPILFPLTDASTKFSFDPFRKW